MRSLHADGRSRRAIWFLLIPVAVLAAWCAWFLEARIPRYRSSDRAMVQTSSRIIAEFSSSTGIRAGQAARFHANSVDLQAHVMHVAESPGGHANIELVLDSTTPPPIGTSGTVEIEMEHVSPAALLLRAAGEHGKSR